MNKLIKVSSILIVTILTLAGCSLIHDQVGEECKTRAYVHMNLGDFITQRFSSHAPVRLGIIPFAGQANISTRSDNDPGVDTSLIRLLQGELLRSEAAPIVEILTRQDWPGKRAEFFSGNFGALRFAKDAGYDLILVGDIEPMRHADRMVVTTKLIEVESGITIFYGRIEAFTWRNTGREATDILGVTPTRPDYQYSYELVGELARCVASEITKED